MKKALFGVVSALAAWHVVVSAQQVSTGVNNNLNPGTADQFVGDRFLQRQVEFKGACSAINPEHCVFGANDYRTVQIAGDSSAGEGLNLATLQAKLDDAANEAKQRRASGPPDAWLGLYRCYFGAEGPCVNGLWPGYPADTTALGTNRPEYGYAAGSDFGIAADANGNFAVVGMFFDRGGRTIVVTDSLTDFNDESLHPIRWNNRPTVLDIGAATSNGQFADLPSLVTDVYRGTGAPTSCGSWHIAWTAFSNNNSGIWWSTSTDCGRTWSGKKKISNPFNSVQRVVLDVDKRPTSQGGGTLYAAFRSFNPDGIVFTALPYGATAWTAPVLMTALSGPSPMCTYDSPTIGTGGSMSDETARALAFPSMQADASGNLFIALTERVDPVTGLPGSGASCNTSQPARIVVTKSIDGGATWSQRRAVDYGSRCETSPQPNVEQGPVEVPCSTGGPNRRAAGIQMQPTLRSNAGHLLLMYTEGRGGLGQTGFFGGRDARMDMRVARLDPATLSLLATAQVSKYEIDAKTGDYAGRPGVPPGATGWQKTNLPLLPQYSGGTKPFRGDHDDLVATNPFVMDSTVRFAQPLDLPQLRMIGVWGGDNREAGFPGADGSQTIAGDWTQYAPAGVDSATLNCINPTIRNSNGYASYITGPVEAYAAQTFKPLGTIQRTWPIIIRNRTNQIRYYRLTIVEQSGFTGSWKQYDDTAKVLGTASDGKTCAPGDMTCTRVVLLPYASGAFTLFGKGPNTRVASPIQVYVDDVDTPQTPDAIVRVNPNPIQYDFPPPLAGSGINSEERHAPDVNGPYVSDHKATSFKNPTANPTGANPTGANPTGANPTGANAGFTDYTDVQYLVQASALTNTTTAYSSFHNVANPDQINESHLVQVIVTRPLSTPAASLCAPFDRPDSQIITFSPLGGSPTGANPTGANPTGANPTGANPTGANPTGANPTGANVTYAMAPSDAPVVGARLGDQFRATALASLDGGLAAAATTLGPDGTVVANPPPNQVLVTIRFWHCRIDGQCGGLKAESPDNEKAPVTVDQANNTVTVVVIPEPWDTLSPTPGQSPQTDGFGPPVMTLPSNLSLEATGASGAIATFTASAVDFSTSTPVAVACLPTSGSPFPIGTTTVTCTSTSSSGSTATGSFTVTVKDTTAPTIAAHADVPSSGSIEATAPATPVSYTAPATSDIVDGSGVAICTPASGAGFPVGDTTVTCTKTDAHGNVATPTSFVVHVVDTTPPAIVGVSGPLTLEATSASGAVVNYTTPTASDLVDLGVPVSCVPASGSTFGLGSTSVTCSATDAHLNTASKMFVVTVVDTTAPTLSNVPANISVEATSAAGAVVTYTSPVASDVVSGSTPVSCLPAAGSTFPLGTTTVRCTSSDAAGNAASASFTVTVRDTTAPTITGVPAPFSVQATGPSGATATYALPTASDSVSGPTVVTCVPASGSLFPLGATTVRCTTTDPTGNAASASFVVTVIDTTAPTVTVPAPIVIEATAASGATVTYTASALDLVSGAVTTTCLPASGSTFPIATTPVSCTATDANGNTGTNSFTVTVRDTTPPTLTLPAPITKAATSQTGAVVTWVASAVDIVDGAVTPACLPVSGSTFAVGTTTINCTASDSRGNVRSGSFTVTVTPLQYGLVNVQDLPPPANKTFNVGSSVPLTWQWTVGGVVVDTPDAVSRPLITVRAPNGTVFSFPDDPGSSGYQYNTTTFTHQYNWQTKGLVAGTYSVTVTSRQTGQSFGPYPVQLK